MNDPAGDAAADRRPRIAFFSYHDVFEDFFPHFGVSQESFARRWANSVNHAYLSLLQSSIGDVTWYMQCIDVQAADARHETSGFAVKFIQDSCVHRLLWRAFYLPRGAWQWYRLYKLYAIVASYLSLCSPRLLKKLIHDRPDFLLSQSYSTGRFDFLILLSRFLRVPLVARHAGSRSDTYLGLIAKRWTVPRADCLLVSSRREAAMVIDRFGADPARVEIVLTPIDMGTYRPFDREESCRFAGLSPERRYVLFVGRLDDPVKQVSALIRAFASIAAGHPDAELVIVGDGPDRAAVEQVAAGCLPGRVRFAGWVSGGPLLAHHYCSAECLVLPSLKEAFPGVVAEAMACGTPVIASDVGGVSEMVINGRTGWLVPPEDQGALTRALAECLNGQEKLGAMRHEARRMAEARLSPEVAAAALRRVFSQSER